jgi:hypothetical protein
VSESRVYKTNLLQQHLYNIARQIFTSARSARAFHKSGGEKYDAQNVVEGRSASVRENIFFRARI